MTRIFEQLLKFSQLTFDLKAQMMSFKFFKGPSVNGVNTLTTTLFKFFFSFLMYMKN